MNSPLCRPLPKPATPNPVELYLLSLPSPRSRARMASAAQQLARAALAPPAALAALPVDAARVPWGALSALEVSELVRRLDGFAPATQRLHVHCLRGILRAAGVNPAVVACARPSQGTRGPAGRALGLDELRRLRRAARGQLRDQALLVLLAEGALRVSEATGADAADWDGAVLRIVGKGNRERRVPFEPEHALVISAYLAGRREGPLLVTWKGPGAGGRMSVRGAQLLLETMAKRAGIARLSPHDLRRTCLTIGAQAGVSAPQLQAFAGHRHLATTQRYLRADPLELSKTAARRRLEFMREHARCELPARVTV